MPVHMPRRARNVWADDYRYGTRQNSTTSITAQHLIDESRPQSQGQQSIAEPVAYDGRGQCDCAEGERYGYSNRGDNSTAFPCPICSYWRDQARLSYLSYEELQEPQAPQEIYLSIHREGKDSVHGINNARQYQWPDSSDQGLQLDSVDSKSFKDGVRMNQQEIQMELVGMPYSRMKEPEKRQGDNAEMQLYYLGGKSMFGLILGLMLMTFAVGLDNTVLATALPTIATQFGSLRELLWYTTTYSLALVSLQPSFGKICMFWNVKYAFIVAVIIFELGSVLSAIAKNAMMFIIARTVCGIGAAGVTVGIMTIIGFAAPIEKRPAYISLNGVIFGLASMMGPVVGGVLTDQVNWSWCYWINPIFGALGIAAVSIFFQPPERKESSLSFGRKLLELDIPGGLLIVAASMCVLCPLQQAGNLYPWTDVRVWGLLALGFPLLLGIFIYWQKRRGDRAVIPPRLVFQRTVAAACAFTFFQTALLYAYGTYLPFFFQVVQGSSATETGLHFMPLLGSVVVFGVLVGIILPEVGFYNPFLIAGAAIATVGSALMYTIHMTSPMAEWMGYQVLLGIGIGMSNSLPAVAIQNVLRAEDYPSGNAMLLFFRGLSAPMVVGVSQNLLQLGIFREASRLVPSVSPAMLVNGGVADLRGSFPDSVLPGILKAYETGVKYSFIPPLVCGALSCLVVWGIEWKRIKPRRNDATAASKDATGASA